MSCQHLYMRANSAERKLMLASSSGDLRVNADEFWHIKKADVSFEVVLKSGTPSEDDVAYITERQKHCPVSSNLPESVQLTCSVDYK